MSLGLLSGKQLRYLQRLHTILVRPEMIALVTVQSDLEESQQNSTVAQSCGYLC